LIFWAHGFSLAGVLIKIRKLSGSFTIPKIEEIDGVDTMTAEMLGELVRVPEGLRDAGELMVGELNLGLYPLGLDVHLDKPHDYANGLWVQRPIYNAISSMHAAGAS
jgi:hypothetical protein